MKQLLYSVLMTLIHPYKSSIYFYNLKTRRVLEDIEWQGAFKQLIRPSYYELMFLTWIAYAISSIYSLATFNSSNIKTSTIATTIGAFVALIIFPIILWLQKKIWLSVVMLFMKLYGFEDLNKDEIEKIVEVSFLSIIFAIIPFLGGIIQIFSFYIIFFAGLTKFLRLSKLEASLLLLTPTIFLLGVIGLFLFAFS